MNHPRNSDEETLAQWVREAGNPNVSPRPEHAERLRAMILDQIGPAETLAHMAAGTQTTYVIPLSTLERTRKMKRIAKLAVAATILVALGVFIVKLGSDTAWAQVVDAVRAKPWVHGVSQPTDGTEKMEMWFSLKSAVAAMRHGDWAVYDDGRSGVRQEYDPKQNEVCQSLAPGFSEKEIRSIQTIFADLFSGSEKLGPDLAGMRIIKQERRRVSDEGREWIDHALTFEGQPGTMRIVFRVDPQTRLPHSMAYFDVGGPTAEMKPRMKFVLDYPEEGPADIYALGVPRSAKVVDRVPRPELARVIDGVRSSRRRFADSYYAIVAETYELEGRHEKWWQAANVHQVWCKGDCLRVEQGRPRNTQAPGLAYTPAEPPAEGIDQMAWWKEHLKDFDFEPAGVCDGKAIYAPKRASPSQLARQKNPVWETWQKINPGEGKSWAASFNPVGLFLPELYAYSVGIGNPYRDTVVELDPNPSGDPANTLLLKYRRRSDDPNAISSCRYWVDPARSYVTLRYELGEVPDPKAGPNAKWPDTYVMEDIRQAPSGIWYAAVVRRLFPGKHASPDKRGAMIFRFFIDFKADMPDTLFKPGPLAVEKTTKAPASIGGANNLRSIALAMHRHHNDHGKFPAAYTVDKQGRPLLSWRVQLLPLLGQEELYKQFHLDEPWDSQHNRTLIAKMPEVYRSPALGAYSPPGAKAKKPGQTNYVVPVGKDTAFPGSDALGARDIKDGCAFTIMAVEVDDDHAVIWTKPEDLPFDAAKPAEGLAKLPKAGFWSVLCDGSVRWIPNDFDPKYLRAALTRAGGEAFEW